MSYGDSDSSEESDEKQNESTKEVSSKAFKLSQFLANPDLFVMLTLLP